MIIYCTTNLINGRRYIGLDSNNNPKYLGSGKAFKIALKKYGKENFRKDILTHCKTLSELLKMEEFYIKRLNAVKSKKFYNIAEGGGKVITKKICQYDLKGNLLNCWDSISAVEKELGFNNSKITSCAKGNYGRRTSYGFVWRYSNDKFEKYPTTNQYNFTEYQRKKLSEKIKGNKNPMFGKKGILHPNHSKVNQYDLNGNFIKTWNTINEAQKTLNINNISMCCNNKRKKAGNFIWKYFKDIVQSSEKSENIS